MNKHGNLTKLAQLAGVSLTTASRALNNHPYVSEEIRKRVFETASRLNYLPRRAARKKKVGIVISNPGNARINFYQGAMLSDNNGLERIMREIRRRTRVVGSFPDGYSAMMLVGARLRHISTTKWGTRQYLACKTYETDVL